jgi:hypothetical protein
MRPAKGNILLITVQGNYFKQTFLPKFELMSSELTDWQQLTMVLSCEVFAQFISQRASRSFLTTSMRSENLMSSDLANY